MPEGEFQLTKAQEIRSSMKVSLAALYAAQKAFYSEFGRYSTDFHALGYSPGGENMQYKTGFLRAYLPKQGRSPSEATQGPVLSHDDLDADLRRKSSSGSAGAKGLSFAPGMEYVRLEQAAGFCRDGCTASETGFEILSVANLDQDPDLDVWVINENKEMLHVQDDLAVR
jgi:hypothetical protein